jgi:ADP-heptose:LPS heptosyltransferase
MAPHNPPSRPRILLVKLSSFGDVLHALPTLEALRTAYPTAHITWLVEAAYAPLLSGHPALNEVWIAPRLRPAEFFSGSNSANLRRLVRQLRSRPFDLVVDVQGLLKSAVWVALARSPRKVGYDKTRELSYLALTERVPPFDPEAHAVWRYLNLAHYLGAPPALPRFRLGLDAAVDISGLVPAEADRPLVVLHPGARWASKLWPPASWASLSEWFHGQGFQVAVTGSTADRELVAAIAAQCRANISGPACRHLAQSAVSRHHRHRGHAPGSKPGDAGCGPVRPYRPLAHRAFRRRAPGSPLRPFVQPLL